MAIKMLDNLKNGKGFDKIKFKTNVAHLKESSYSLSQIHEASER